LEHVVRHIEAITLITGGAPGLEEIFRQEEHGRRPPRADEFRTYSAKRTGRGAISHYDTMTFDEIKALPVSDWASPDCALPLLWVPGPHLMQGLQLINAWGFDFKGLCFVWVKPTKSVGQLPD
jgi:hypothetical protein